MNQSHHIVPAVPQTYEELRMQLQTRIAMIVASGNQERIAATREACAIQISSTSCAFAAAENVLRRHHSGESPLTPDEFLRTEVQRNTFAAVLRLHENAVARLSEFDVSSWTR